MMPAAARRDPTREDYIAMGVSPKVAELMTNPEALERDRAALHTEIMWQVMQERQEHEVRAQSAPGYRVLDMTGEAEAAAMRFMDEGWEAHRRYAFFAPSVIWIMGWALIGTAHGRLHGFARPSHYRTDIELPCSFQALMEYFACPAIDEHEAKHRAERFCSLALDRARQLYRDGFYADPFTPEPVRRQVTDQPPSQENQ